LILLCQLAGETIVLLTGLPVPGPVLGMLLLLGWLFLRGGISEDVGRTADALLAHFSLLFVPGRGRRDAALGAHPGQWPAIAAALLLGTSITLAVTALTMAGAQRLSSAVNGVGGKAGD
jgi:holin-like protein